MNPFGKPKPQVILTHNYSNHKARDIMKAAGIWAVCYEDTPINMKDYQPYIDPSYPKYGKTAFPNPGHAFNLADKLNVMFKTDKFCVYFFSTGVKVVEGHQEDGNDGATGC